MSNEGKNLWKNTQDIFKENERELIDSYRYFKEYILLFLVKF